MTPESLESGLKHHQAGDLDQAEQVYRRILRIDPRHPDALHLLGVVGHQRGQGETAVALIGEAISVHGTNPLYHSNLGAAYLSLQRHAEAAQSFRRAVELNPRYADAHFNLGVSLESLDQPGEAEAAYQQTLRIRPDHAEAHNNLGNIQKSRGRPNEAAEHYRQALSVRPHYAAARFNLGTVLQALGDADRAADCYAEAIALQPDYAEAHWHLGLSYAASGQLELACRCYETAVQQQPNWPHPWLSMGSALIARGRLEEARRALAECQSRLVGQVSSLPEERRGWESASSSQTAALAGALVELSRAQSRGGDHPSARQTLEQARIVQPDSAELLFELGSLHQSAGEWDAAARFFEDALAQHPDSAIGHNNLAVVRAGQCRIEEAAACCQRALAIDPEFAEAHYNLGNFRRDQGHADEAAGCYREALRIQPGMAAAHNNLGSLLQSQQRLADAAACYRQAIAHRPEFALAHSNLGSVLQTLGAMDDAAACYRRAVEIEPNSPQAQNGLGTIAAMHQQTDVAINHFRACLAASPGHADALTNLGNLFKSQGRVEESRACFQQALQVRPRNELRVLLATLLPPVYDSREDLHAWRERFAGQVAALVGDGVTLDPQRETLPSNFYLAYQGLNDRELQQQMARLYPPVDCRTLGRPAGGKMRVGFLSRNFRAHTVGRLMHGWIAGMNRDEFEVVVLSLGQSKDMLAQQIRADADQAVTLPESLALARETIAAEKLDALVFADVGMDPLTYSLSFTRFANVQCVTWGHPVTTGSPAIDYFLSSELVEPPNADDHYSETLIRLKGLPTIYSRPNLPDPLRPRSAFGLPDDANLYLCPQSLFKFHPDFDGVLGQILDRDPRGRLILLQGMWPHWTEALKARFERTIPQVASRVQFLPQQDHAAFLNLLALGDVMLDPLHFGGGNSTFEAVAAGVPIVTLPGEFMRGRVTAGCYWRMGFEDCIAGSEAEYVNLAVRLATDRALGRHVRERIASSRMALFSDTSVLEQLEDFLRRAIHGQLKPNGAAGAHQAPAALSGLVASATPVQGLTPPPIPRHPVGADRAPSASVVCQDEELVAAPDCRPVRPPLRDILRAHTCPACGHHVAVPFFDGGQQPLTTLAWPRSVDEAQAMPRLPHTFVRCVDCGHVYNCQFDYANVPYSDKPNLMFNRGQLWTEHLQRVRDLILERVGPEPTVVEIGCGDGHLLRALARERPAGRYVGFDPSGAIDDGGGLIAARTELFLPDRHLAELRPDLIVSRHVLEHLMNPLGFVQALGFACSWENAETLLLIEVPCIDQVFTAGRTVDFFYEHNSHFTTVSLRRLLLRCATEVELIDRSYNNEVVYGLARFRQRSEQVDFAADAVAFRNRAAEFQASVRGDIERLAASDKRVAVWGGTGKAAAFINQHGLDAARFPIVVDSDPDKARTFVPGTGQEIRHRDFLREHAADVILIATQWRAADIVLEIERCGLSCEQILVEHQGRLVDFHRGEHPYRRAA